VVTAPHRSSSWLVVVLAACGTPRVVAPPVPDRIAIIVSERAGSGTRLVALDERGDRQLDVVAPAVERARDTHPAVSPDGAWVVFASSRGRPFDQTSLWIAPLARDAMPVQLTHDAIDVYPTWTPDGRAIVYASARGGAAFDLFRLVIANGRPAGPPEQLTSAPGNEVSPAVASDGTVVYDAVTTRADGTADSHLEARAPDGAIRALTAGPTDATPALSPDGKTIAFSRAVEHAGALDADLWLLPVGSDHARQLVDVPLTDEAGPVWSPDGRYVFATSVLRDSAGAVLFSSVIVVDARARHPVARMLEDRVGAIARLTPAITRAPLDPIALAADPEYLPELRRIVASALAHAPPEQDRPARP
jgi:Tol biopolymer transport system component